MSTPSNGPDSDPGSSTPAVADGKPDHTYGRVHGRLAQFRQWTNNSVDWHERWTRRPLDKVLAPHAQGELGEFEIFTKYLPREGRVLEAGCGQGQLVMALDARGYAVEGVDYAEQTVRQVLAAAPHLKLRTGDVYALDAPDGHYSGYISIGVFEHEVEGPWRGLHETRRVLKDGGIAYIALPHLNRKRSALLRRAPEVEPGRPLRGLDFYQYYYSEREFHSMLEEAGFDLVEMYYYGLYSALTRDFALGRHLDRKGFYVYRLHRRVAAACLKAPQPLIGAYGHMAMYICRARP